MAAPPLKLKRGTTSVASPVTVPNTVAGEPVVRYNTDQGKYAGITEFYVGDDGATSSKLVADSGATSAANAMLTEAGASTSAVLTLNEDTNTGTDFIAIDVPAAGTITSYTLTLPSAVGGAGDVLALADVDGNLQWSTTGTTNDSTVTLTAGAGLADGGSFTTNQGSPSAITFNVGAGNGITVNPDTIEIDTSVTADLSSAQTLTNKTLQDSTTSIVDNGDATKVLQFDAAGIATATTRTLTAPNADGTIALTSSSTGVVVESVAATASAGIAIGGTATAPTVGLANAGSLTTNDVLKWDGSQLVDSSITDDGTTVTIAANLTVTGTTTTVSTANTVVADRILELANGATGTPAATSDAGIVVERGDSTNVFFGFDEGVDVFVAGTTAITGSGGDAAPTPIAFLALQYNVTDTAGTNEAVISYLAGNVDYTGQPAGRYLSNVTIDCGEY